MAGSDDVVIALAGLTAFLIDAEDVDYYLRRKLKKKRRHRFWQREWMKARNNPQQANTVYKLQQELLEVGLFILSPSNLITEKTGLTQYVHNNENLHIWSGMSTTHNILM